jgi:hypothetical protein
MTKVDSNQATRTPKLVDPKWQAAVPLFSWGGLLSPVFWFMLAAAVGIGLFVPEQVARDTPELRQFASTVRAALMRVSRYADINAHASLTAFPNVALLSHAWLWVSMVVLFALNLMWSLLNWRYWMEWFALFHHNLSRKHRKATLLSAPFVLLGVVVFSMMPGSASFVGEADLASPIFFAFLTGSAVFLWQVSTSGLLPALYVICTSQPEE